MHRIALIAALLLAPGLCLAQTAARQDLPQVWTGLHQNVPRQVLTVSGTTFTPPSSFGNYWITTSAASQTVACPTSMLDGDSISFHIQQGASAPFSPNLTFASPCYGWVSGVAPTLSTAANQVDWIFCLSQSPSDVTGSNFVCEPHLNAAPPPVPGTFACDFGPAYTGTVPSAALQAFGTTPKCVINLDFTVTSAFTDTLPIAPASTPVSHTWSTISSWFSCSNVAGPWLLSYKDFSDTACTTGTGNHVNVALDGSIQTLQLTYFLSDKTAGQYSVSLTTGAQVGTGPPPAGTNGLTFPQAVYVEQTIRTNTNAACTTPGCLMYTLLTYAPDYNSGNPCFVSSDFAEQWSNSGPNGGLHAWNPTCGTSGDIPGPATNPGPIMGPTYATYGALWTNDGTAHEGLCNYYRAAAVRGLQGQAVGDFRSCISPYTVPGSSPSTAIAHRQYLQLWEGPQSAGAGGSFWTATSQTTFIQRTTVWSCPGYASGNCVNNPIITTGAP